ncbi:hypothetical protein [Aquimarina litoralis]|uniref:hypothetical protein n=1 Tax=Aquimarina litoralis TaxID=584605 RepID=UPI001C58E0D8|nr:hypothetical protein [Aquimarina litoralis]MBW1298517.1 hypothetical protein [Aquimarina litoralis]
MQNQQHLFDLSEEIIYLNGAYMSPQLKSVTEIGISAVQRKAQPYQILPEDFFSLREVLPTKKQDLL